MTDTVTVSGKTSVNINVGRWTGTVPTGMSYHDASHASESGLAEFAVVLRQLYF